MINKYFNFITISLLIILIKTYQFFISPFINSNCRFAPTCSEYAITSLKLHGLVKGLYYITKRILSCHPLGRQGHDPVPRKINKEN